MTHRAAGRFEWRVLAALGLLSLVGVLAILPSTAALVESLILPIPLWIVLTSQAVQMWFLSLGASVVGLKVGSKIGLGAPLLVDLANRVPGAAKRARVDAWIGLLAGIPAAVTILVLELGLFARTVISGPDLGITNKIWVGIFASLYGAITEEILLRFGLLTALVWLISKVVNRPIRGLYIWIAIGISALVFGLGHLPATAVFAPLTPLLITRALMLNGFAGTILGWLYWKRSLVAAMSAHLAIALLLNVAAPSACVELSLHCPSLESKREQDPPPVGMRISNMMMGYNNGKYEVFARDFDSSLRSQINEGVFSRTVRGKIFETLGHYRFRRLTSLKTSNGLLEARYRASFQKEAPVQIIVFLDPANAYRIKGVSFKSRRLFRQIGREMTRRP